MAKRVAINGFGRIGRNFFRAYLKRDPGFEVVAINDLASDDVLAHMLKYDSTHGVLQADVSHGEGELIVDGTSIRVLSERDPAALPWGELGIDVVVESTGLFTARDGAQKHLDAGAKKIVISAPATDPDVTIVLGVNDDTYDPEQHHIVSNASCTTNSVAPMAKVLLDEFGIEQGFMTTIHAYTTVGQAGSPADASRTAEHHPVDDRSREGDRARHSRAEGQARRDGHAGARSGRERDGPRLHPRA